MTQEFDIKQKNDGKCGRASIIQLYRGSNKELRGYFWDQSHSHIHSFIFLPHGHFLVFDTVVQTTNEEAIVILQKSHFQLVTSNLIPDRTAVY